jgi:Malectin domain
MKNKTSWVGMTFALLILASAAMLIAGCQSAKTPAPAPAPTAAPTATVTPATPVAAAPAVTPPPAPVVAAPASAPGAMLPPVHIKAGLASSLTNADGVVWIADTGFADGDVVERDSELSITNTTTPALYRTERYGMTAFSYPVPNGKYIVKLHFAETFDGITGAGERVFSFNVEGTDFKDFDLYVKAGGPQRAYIETVPVEVTDGKLDITFTANVQSPEINGIEILPAP